MTGLDPGFVGESDDSTYCPTLRREFPSAQFLGGQSAYDDFQMQRKAKHIAIAVSSYSYVDYIGSPQGFYQMSLREIAALHRKASLQTAVRSLRIHAGVALRMLTS
jgi:hypothetical protein